MAWSSRILVLAAAAGVLLGAASLRSGEYDEQYTRFIIAGDPRPAWPDGVFSAGTMRGLYTGQASLARIAQELRQTDVHPPLYFWAVAGWRALAGPGLFQLRLFSVACGLAALLTVGAIATLASVPPPLTMLLTAGSYGFVYTGAIARDFALAQVLTLLGVWLALRAKRDRLASVAFMSGLLLGAASFTNYLTVFVAGAVLLWLTIGTARLSLAAWLGFALLLPADLWFFAAQHGSRVGQFPPFDLLPSLARLAQFLAASLSGGLPRYVDGVARLVVSSAGAILLLGLAGLVIARWRTIGQPDTRRLLAMAAIAPPIGLLLLGLIFNTTPIELRYLSFAAPFMALLLAGALGRRMAIGLLTIQALALAGLLTRPETMQPARATAREAAALAGNGVVVLPRGNDGVGIPGAFVAEAPDGLRLLVVDRTASAEQIRAGVAGFHRVVLALLEQDDASRATLPSMRAAFAGPCWRGAANGFNVLAFEQVCEGDADVLRWLHAHHDPGPGR